MRCERSTRDQAIYLRNDEVGNEKLKLTNTMVPIVTAIIGQVPVAIGSNSKDYHSLSPTEPREEGIVSFSIPEA